MSHGTIEAVEIAGKHQGLTMDLAKVMVRPGTTRARLATSDRAVQWCTMADTTVSVVLG